MSHKSIIVGTIGKIDFKDSKEGKKAVIRMRVVWNERHNGDNVAHWCTCLAFGAQAEHIDRQFEVSDGIYLETVPRKREDTHGGEDDKDIETIYYVDKVDFLP